jgi:hypothetical protein
MIKPVSYHAVAEFLGGLPHLAQIVALYRELADGKGAHAVADMAVAILDYIAEADLFPIHAHDEYEIRDAVAQGDLPPLSWFVHFEGFDPDDEWEFYGPAVQLVMALMGACGHGYLYEEVYCQEALALWEEYREEYGLPENLDGERVVANLRRQKETPWSGMWAIWRWVECATGNWFVDIPCSYSAECDLDVDWNIASVRLLQREYAAAVKEIFHPCGELEARLTRDRTAIRTCLEIAADDDDADDVPDVPCELIDDGYGLHQADGHGGDYQACGQRYAVFYDGEAREETEEDWEGMVL